MTDIYPIDGNYTGTQLGVMGQQAASGQSVNTGGSSDGAYTVQGAFSAADLQAIAADSGNTSNTGQSNIQQYQQSTIPNTFPGAAGESQQVTTDIQTAAGNQNPAGTSTKSGILDMSWKDFVAIALGIFLMYYATRVNTEGSKRE